MRSSVPQENLEPAKQNAEEAGTKRRSLKDIFVSPGTRKAALVITLVLPVLWPLTPGS